MGAGEQQIILRAKAHSGKINVYAEIPVTGDDTEYVVTIALTPQPVTGISPFEHLYGILADSPMPEVD